MLFDCFHDFADRRKELLRRRDLTAGGIEREEGQTFERADVFKHHRNENFGIARRASRKSAAQHRQPDRDDVAAKIALAVGVFVVVFRIEQFDRLAAALHERHLMGAELGLAFVRQRLCERFTALQGVGVVRQQGPQTVELCITRQ